MHEKCSGYIWLNESNRSQKSQGDFHCDHLLSGWYRFGEGAGTKIATSCVPSQRCGTMASGWMNGLHPPIAHGKVTKTVCFHFHGDCCVWSKNIEVVNCGQYYVYQFISTPSVNPCSLRYCGSDN